MFRNISGDTVFFKLRSFLFKSPNIIIRQWLMFEFFVAGSVSGVVASLNIGFPRHRRITKLPQAFTALPDNCPPLFFSLKNSKKRKPPPPHIPIVEWWVGCGAFYSDQKMTKYGSKPEWAAERPLQLILGQDPDLLRFKKIQRLNSNPHNFATAF